MKIASLGDVVFTCMIIICSMVKCKCLWRGRLVMVSFANMFEYYPKSGFFDLLSRETLIVLSYNCCDSPSITSIQTEYLCGVKDLFVTIALLHEPCDHKSYEDILRSVWCCLVSPIVIYCVCMIGLPNNRSIICLQHYN